MADFRLLARTHGFMKLAEIVRICFCLFCRDEIIVEPFLQMLFRLSLWSAWSWSAPTRWISEEMYFREHSTTVTMSDWSQSVVCCWCLCRCSSPTCGAPRERINRSWRSFTTRWVSFSSWRSVLSLWTTTATTPGTTKPFTTATREEISEAETSGRAKTSGWPIRPTAGQILTQVERSDSTTRRTSVPERLSG